MGSKAAIPQLSHGVYLENVEMEEHTSLRSKWLIRLVRSWSHFRLTTSGTAKNGRNVNQSCPMRFGARQDDIKWHDTSHRPQLHTSVSAGSQTMKVCRQNSEGQWATTLSDQEYQQIFANSRGNGRSWRRWGQEVLNLFIIAKGIVVVVVINTDIFVAFFIS